MRFEKLGLHDYAVYVNGFTDAIGKAGQIGDDCWFQARADLGGGITWEKTMIDAVRAWATARQRTQLQKEQLRQLIERERLFALLSPLPTERYEEETDDED